MNLTVKKCQQTRPGFVLCGRQAVAVLRRKTYTSIIHRFVCEDHLKLILKTREWMKADIEWIKKEAPDE